MNEAVLKIMPRMLMGEELDAALRVLPAYDPYMREQGKVERLMSLENLYHVFIPSQMGREIYSKLYLSMLHSLQKKSGILAVQQSYENRRSASQTVLPKRIARRRNQTKSSSAISQPHSPSLKA